MITIKGGKSSSLEQLQRGCSCYCGAPWAYVEIYWVGNMAQGCACGCPEHLANQMAHHTAEINP